MTTLTKMVDGVEMPLTPEEAAEFESYPTDWPGTVPEPPVMASRGAEGVEGQNG